MSYHPGHDVRGSLSIWAPLILMAIFTLARFVEPGVAVLSKGLLRGGSCDSLGSHQSLACAHKEGPNDRIRT